MTSNKTGLAFSGGGIRSAALCSGVLRRLLKDKAKVDYLSCVSGVVTQAHPFWIGNTEKRRKQRKAKNGMKSSLTTCDKELVIFVTGRGHVKESLIRL